MCGGERGVSVSTGAAMHTHTQEQDVQAWHFSIIDGPDYILAGRTRSEPLESTTPRGHGQMDTDYPCKPHVKGHEPVKRMKAMHGSCSHSVGCCIVG